MATEKNNPALGQDLEAAPSAVPNTTANHDSASSAKDEAIAMVGEQEHALDPVIVARAVRKIDWFLIPAMIFGCAYPTPISSSPTP
jgi:hypothetical protein